jgi:hypothetical protein
MSSQPGPTQSTKSSDEERSESVVGVYDTPEQRRPPMLTILIVLVVIALVAALVIWLI